MRPLHIYLVIYFALIAGAGIALWQGGVLSRISPVSIAVCVVVAVALGLAVALTSVTSTRA